MNKTDLDSPAIIVRKDSRIYTLSLNGELHCKEAGRTRRLGNCRVAGKLSITEFHRLIGIVP